MEISCNNYQNFTGRCRQIKKAQWVVHAINANLPHQSASRNDFMITEMYDKLQRMRKNSKAYNNFQQVVERIMDGQDVLAERIQEARGYSYGYARLNSYNRATADIMQLRDFKLGNCHEDAIAAETILKANGIENPAIVILNGGVEQYDHVVCAFNKDNSKVYRIVNNKTIFVDPWLGIADFANVLLKKYKTCYSKFFSQRKQDFTVRLIEKTATSPEDIDLFRRTYPELVQKKTQ